MYRGEREREISLSLSSERERGKKKEEIEKEKEREKCVRCDDETLTQIRPSNDPTFRYGESIKKGIKTSLKLICTLN